MYNVHPWPELNNGDLLGKVVLLQPRDVFGMKAFNFNMALVISTLWVSLEIDW
jgi:hypothetical protein